MIQLLSFERGGSNMDMSMIRITELHGVFRMSHKVGGVRDFNDRESCGLVFVQSGVLRFDCEGRKYFCDSRRVLFIPKGISYSLVCTEKCLHYTANFDLLCCPVEDFIEIPVAPSARVFAQLNKMFAKWEFHRESHTLGCLSLLYDILSWLNNVGSQDYQQKARYDIIRPSIEYIEMHYTDPDINNDRIAQASRVSTVYFRKLFTRLYGTPPMQYIRQKRIESARNMLHLGYRNIGEIAENVGYGSIYHFSKSFREVVGLSPSTYARSIIADSEVQE